MFAFLILTILTQCVYLAHAQPGLETCNPGTFRSGLECIKCPPGTFSTDFNLLSCKRCPAGRFRSTEGASSKDQCLFCPAGTSSSEEGSTSCKKCDPGLDSLPGSQFCGRCGPGTALSRFIPPCEPCPRAFFSNGTTNRFCRRCPDGTFTAGGSDPFRLTPVGTTECEKCPPGTYRRNSEFDFNPVSVFLSNQCTTCQRGTFNDVAGARSCKLCPTGTFSEKGATRCTPCPKGRANNRIFSVKCRRCAKGLITVGTGAAQCKHPTRGCPFDTFEDAKGECKSCMPGERLDANRRKCVPCGRNQVSRGGVSTSCKRCPRNKIPFGDLSREEGSGCLCKPGFIDDGEGGCEPCAAGTFWENDFSFFRTVENFARTKDAEEAVVGICTKCPQGSFSSKPGQTSCTPCPENSFQRNMGASSCIKCPRGSRTPRILDDSFSDAIGFTNCITDEFACAAGEIRDANGKCKAERCPLKNTVLQNGACVGNCPPGTVRRGKRCIECFRGRSPGGTTTKCTPCPENQRQSANGNTCTCESGRALVNGKCVECPPGTLHFDTQDLNGKCVACPEGTAESTTQFSTCETCRRTFFTSGTGAIRCVQCPLGTTRFRDILGKFPNECRSKDRFEK